MTLTAANKELNEEKPLYLIAAQRKMSAIYAEAEKLKTQNDPIVQQTLGLEVQSLKTAWLSENHVSKDLTPEMFSTLENIFITQSANTPKGLNYVKAFFDVITEMVFIDLTNWLAAYIYIYIYIYGEEFAGELFKFCEEAPRTNSRNVFLGNLILKLRFPNENDKFDFLMNIAEKYPSIFSGEGMAHPSYIFKHSSQRTFEKCPVCGGEGKPYHCSFSYRMANFDHPFQPFKLWMRCENCQNLYTKQFPEEFLALSTQHKTVTPSGNSETAVSDIASAHALAIWSSILNKLKTYTSKKSLLEVGIGHGELLSVALEMGYEVNAVEIVEESAQSVSDILGIPVWNGDFLNYSPDRTYPIITMGDVIEHVTDPEAALRNVYRLLDDDGALWLSTPNFESSFTRLRKFTDAMWLEPYHISYFSYRGLEALLDKVGFTVREYSVSNRYNGSMELIITKK